MIKVSPQFVVDEEQQPQAVLLTIYEWDSILEELEELEDIRAYDLVKASEDEHVTFEQAVREIEKYTLCHSREGGNPIEPVS